MSRRMRNLPGTRVQRVLRVQRVSRVAMVAVAACLSVVSCSTNGLYQPTPIPPRPAAATPEPGGATSSPTTSPSGSPSTSPSTTSPSGPPPGSDVTTANCLQSYAPPAGLPAPGQMPAGSTMSRIQSRGRLVVGVSADTLLLGSRNPRTGRIEGFDIDMVRAVAQAIFGDSSPSRVQPRVITAAQRAAVLENGSVDIVARAMTITCKRWKDVAFSSEYYRSGQKVLVRLGEKTADGRPIARIQDLVGKKVCAPKGTSAMDSLRTFPGLVPVGADTHTGCLVLFQEGQVDAISGDATVLAGLAAQDPYAQVVKAPAFTVEPYGLAVNKENVDLVRFVNGVLEQMRSDGRWTASYNRWLAGPLGPVPGPPTPVYGRTP